MNSEVLIAGGGISGLTAAAFLAERGVQVTIAEASNEWGGCAGKFQRGPFLFPAGATLGMGFEQGGIHQRLFDKLGIPFPYAKPLDTVMGIHTPRGYLEYKQDRSRHLEEMARVFPEASGRIRSFYREVWQIGAEVKKLLGPLPVLPLKNFRDTADLLFSLKPSSMKMLPYFRKTIGQLLNKHTLHDVPAFVHLLDAQLIDSMQTDTSRCSAIMGAYALTIYHEGAFYIEGGLNQLAEVLRNDAYKNGAVLSKRTWIQSISQNAEGLFEAVDQKGKVWTARHFISTLPVQNLLEVLDEPLKEKIGNRYGKKAASRQWGTMTMYMAVKEEAIPKGSPLFQQVLLDDKGKMTEGDHLFLSLSSAADRLRAPEGYRTLNASTHTSLDLWDTKEKYDAYKQQLRDKMMLGIQRAIPLIEEGIVKEETGAPKAWERFTKRKDGMVGGLPQTLDNALFNSLSHRTGVKGLWVCGDSVFPGAGTAGVSVSGYHVYRSVMRELKRGYL
ncbi:FAD-dependent oxidoreductase [Bacillus sp. FJAT-42376]|uniref:FAD-dependent oxidoreductase n=1 Tax=Bacillus sp. FJAT-42376 TaxID=2014076 RepID=UPI000F509A0C|nr:FAD-dependent oxidoreductase [Bacillus sp. FJAT-42376]AZB41664.1 FAD-dependent oxidoreductase [Bacillus sp. FJAT-42376]